MLFFKGVYPFFLGLGIKRIEEGTQVSSQTEHAHNFFTLKPGKKQSDA